MPSARLTGCQTGPGRRVRAAVGAAGRLLACTRARHSSTCTATTCAPAATRRRWPRWCACSTRSASRRRPCAPRSRGWSCRAGWSRSSWRRAAATAPPTRATRRLDEAADRIYRRTDPAGTACWHLVVRRPRPRERSARHPAARRPGLRGLRRARRQRLGQPLRPQPSCASSSSAPAPRPAPPGPSTSTRRRSRPGTSAPCGRRTTTGWPPPATWSPRQLAAHDEDDEAAFAARFQLVHEWRKFLFADPGLPDELLPGDWPGRAAADLFASEADRLKPGADRFVARCLDA